MNNKLLFLLILILLFVVYNFIKKKEYFFPGMSSDEDFFAPETPEEENTIESTIQNLITGTNIIDVITPDEDSTIHQSGLDSQQVSNPNTSQTDFLTQTMRKFNQNDFSPSPSYGYFSNDLNSHLPEDKNLTPLTKAAYLYHESLGPADTNITKNTPIIDYEKEWRHYPSKFEDRQEGPLKRLEREKKIFKGKKKPFDRELNFNIFDTAVKLELHKLSNIKYNFKLLKNLLYVDANDSNSTNNNEI